MCKICWVSDNYALQIKLVFDPMDKKDTCNQCYENRFGHRLDQGTGLVGQRSNR